MRFTFEVEGKREFDRSFSRIGEHVSDLRPVWDEVERIFYKIESAQFKSEGAQGRSGKWKPLSREYAAQKAKAYGGATILMRTGRMEGSLTNRTGDTVLIKEKLEFGIGTRLFYPAFHQTGTSKMPKREVISFSDANRTELQKGIQKSLLKIIKRDRQVTQSLEVEE